VEKDATVKLERTSTALLDAGRGKEAIEEIRRLVALHPKEARHHLHLALALLRLGMVEAARKEARRGVDQEPGNGWAHRVLAAALEHDLIGRRLQPGCEIAGAVAAQRKAVEVEPDSPIARAHLAWLLLHGDGCVKGGPGARVDEALTLFREVHERLKNETYDADYLGALLWAGRFDAALPLARAMKPDASRDAALLAALAAVEGPEAAAAEAARLTPTDRTSALQIGARHLVGARRYPLAVRLLQLASAGASGAARLQTMAAVFARTERHDRTSLDPKDPAAMPLRLIDALLAGTIRQLAPELLPEMASTEGLDIRADALLKPFRRATGLDLPTDVARDFIRSLVEVQTEAEAPCGRRLRITMPGSPAISMYVVPEKGGWRMLAAAGEPGPLAARARRLAEEGDLAGARRLLGWARDETERRGGGEGSLAEILSALWTSGDLAGADELRLAGAALEAPMAPERALPVLEAAYQAGLDEPRHRAVEWSLVWAYGKAHRPADAVRIADALLARTPSSQRVFQVKGTALVELERHDAARRMANERLAALPDDTAAIRLLASAAQASGDSAELQRQLKRLIALGRGEAGDHNNLAWSALFSEPLAPDALDQAHKAVQLSQERSRAHLHTLAAVHAASGQPHEALEVLAKSIDLGDSGRPASDDWLVIGQVAERYGLFEEAIAAYRRVEPRKKNQPFSPHTLAALRLARLEAQRR
jgi:tetratricopeptide (TPR) repeat protein